jgi:glycosyltransferase involved in cell wall biosynthesis
MKISHVTKINDIEESNGYGYATVCMINSLNRLGYQIDKNDPTADVEIWFDQPQHWNWTPGKYHIGYHPWESTQLKPGWAEKMNECDEIWTPSPLIAEWYTKFAGIKVPVYVYEHGVDDIWTPKERTVEGKFKFLHVGAEAARKGGKEAMQALRLAFPNNNNVEMNLKIISKGWMIGRLPRINIINERYSINQVVDLFHSNNAYVYPSYGEGFGLTPLQAMATGMPTITVSEWAPYKDFIDPQLSVGSHISKSPWPKLHPGNMLTPHIDDVVEGMRYVYENYDVVHKESLDKIDEIREYYDWDRLTKEAFEGLEKRLKNS